MVSNSVLSLVVFQGTARQALQLKANPFIATMSLENNQWKCEIWKPLFYFFSFLSFPSSFFFLPFFFFCLFCFSLYVKHWKAGFLSKRTVLKIDLLYVGPEHFVFAGVCLHFSDRKFYRLRLKRLSRGFHAELITMQASFLTSLRSDRHQWGSLLRWLVHCTTSWVWFSIQMIVIWLICFAKQQQQQQQQNNNKTKTKKQTNKQTYTTTTARLNTPQMNPDEYVFIFHRLAVVLSLEKGAYPPKLV